MANELNRRYKRRRELQTKERLSPGELKFENSRVYMTTPPQSTFRHVEWD